MTLCDFCNDDATEATHAAPSGDRSVNMCYSCMTAFTFIIHYHALTEFVMHDRLTQL